MLTKTPCIHLERLLPGMNDGATSYVTRNEFETTKSMSQEEQAEYEKHARKLERTLKKLGIEKFRVDLLMDRFVSNLTLKEIADKNHYVSVSAVQHLIKTTLILMGSAGIDAAKSLLKDYE